MPRLGYTKSRNGCRKCRQRRVKCDEKRPCGACERHGIVCSLVRDATSSMDASQSPTPSLKGIEKSGKCPSLPDPSRPDTASLVALSSATANSAEMPVDMFRNIAPKPRASAEQTAEEKSREWVTDLELMHHYVMKAYLTLPRAEEVGRIWQVEVVELAFIYEYLLHLVLAFSAFHLAYLRPEQHHRYSYAAAHHQSMGLRDMRTALPMLNAENCHALFMAGSFLAIGKFAALTIYAGDKNDNRPNLEDIIDVFILLKGMNTVLHTWEQVIQQGLFSELFKVSNNTSATLPFWDDIGERLHQLRKLLSRRLVDSPAMASSIDSEVLRLFSISQQAVNYSTAPELRFVMLWPISVSDDYIQMLRKRSPAALTVLSYYCVVVHMAESQTWFTREWAPKLLHAIEVELPQDWTELINWPSQHIYDQP